MDREVLVLIYLEKLSTGEAAAVCGISQEALRSRHRRALLRFGGLIGEAE
jgi:DNA-directed RNA polymerase specialized sigma24 family protein